MYEEMTFAICGATIPIADAAAAPSDILRLPIRRSSVGGGANGAGDGRHTRTSRVVQWLSLVGWTNRSQEGRK